MDYTTVICKEQFAKNILEFLQGAHFNYLFTEPTMFGETSSVIFMIAGNDEDIEFFKKWINGAFSTAAAVVAPIHLDRENQLTDLFPEE